jgi:hypothetical protein
LLQVLFGNETISYLEYAVTDEGVPLSADIYLHACSITRNVSIGVSIRVQLLHALKRRQGQLLCDYFTLIALLEKMEHSAGLHKLEYGVMATVRFGFEGFGFMLRNCGAAFLKAIGIWTWPVGKVLPTSCEAMRALCP